MAVWGVSAGMGRELFCHFMITSTVFKAQTKWVATSTVKQAKSPSPLTATALALLLQPLLLSVAVLSCRC
jgi:hypothetical protein